MKMPNFEKQIITNAFPETLQNTNDQGGRNIVGMEPKLEKFTKLKPGKDLIIHQLTENISSETSIDNVFVFINPINGEELLMVEAPHWRSISMGTKSKYTDEQGQPHFFYEINIKGPGYTKPSLMPNATSINDYDNWTRINEYETEGAFGLANHKEFTDQENKKITEKTQELIAQGFRTELYWAVGELKYIYYKGKKTSIIEAKKNGLIPKGEKYDAYKPSIGVRLLKNNTRVEEIYQRTTDKYHPSEKDRSRATILFKKAFEIFNKELQDSNQAEWETLYNNNEIENLKELNKTTKPKELYWGDYESEKIFYEIFFRRMGKNLAIYLNNGLVIDGLHSSNMTMAAEIADMGDSARWTAFIDCCEDCEMKLQKYSGIRNINIKGIRDISYGLRYLLKSGKKLGLNFDTREKLVRSFLNAFAKNLNNQKLKKQEYTHEDVYSITEKILDRVLIKKDNLPAIKHGANMDEWAKLLELRKN